MPNVITTASITFGTGSSSKTYKVKRVPGGKPVTCEAIDVTCADDSKKKFVPGVLTVNGEINVTIAAETPPTENSKESLTITLGGESVPIGDAIVRSITPSTIEAGGNREATWDVVFQRVGEDPDTSS